jgi:hypothetical protein
MKPRTKVFKIIDAYNDYASVRLSMAMFEALKESDTPATRLKIALEKPEKRMPDLMWAGPRVVVSTRAMECLMGIRGAGFFPVTIQQRPREYHATQLYELWVAKWVSADQKLSTLVVNTEFSRPDAIWYDITGAEEKQMYWDATAMREVVIRKRRDPGKGIIINDSEADGCDIFHVKQTGAGLYCTDKVRMLVDQCKLTNVDMMEVGDIVE